MVVVVEGGNELGHFWGISICPPLGWDGLNLLNREPESQLGPALLAANLRQPVLFRPWLASNRSVVDAGPVVGIQELLLRHMRTSKSRLTKI